TIGIQIRAGTRSAVQVIRRRFGVEVNVTEFRIRGEWPPDSNAARVFRGAIQPGFVTLLAFSRNRMEDPPLLTCPRVVGENVAFDVRFYRTEVGGTDDNHIIG